LGPDDGCPADALDAAERRLGLRLPVALREAYALLGRREDLTSRQDRLYAPDELKLDATGSVLVYRIENQNCAQWGIPIADLHQPDPPTVFHQYGFAEAEWRPWLDRVSLAVLEMVLSEALLGADWGTVYYGNRPLDAAAVGLLERHFTRLAVPDYPLWAEPDGPPVRWFAGPDVLLRDDGDVWLWVLTRTLTALDAVMEEILPGDWIDVGEL
jgi:hypothetical protein